MNLFSSLNLKTLVVFCSLNFWFYAFNQTITIDFKERKSGKITVVESDFNFTKDTILFQFPAVILGSYEQSDFGKYIDNFVVLLKNGKRNKIKKVDVNSYLLNDASSIVEISYTVKQTIHPEKPSDLFLAEGTFFDRESVLLNFHAIAGYADENIHQPRKIILKNKGNLIGSGALKKIFQSENSDTLFAENYHHLIDSPMLYAEFTTETSKKNTF